MRTTNLIERSFEEERRRTKVVPRFFDEKSCLKLAFATLWRASQRWRKVRFEEHERRQIRRLRITLGIDNPKESCTNGRHRSRIRPDSLLQLKWDLTLQESNIIRVQGKERAR